MNFGYVSTFISTLAPTTHQRWLGTAAYKKLAQFLTGSPLSEQRLLKGTEKKSTGKLFSGFVSLLIECYCSLMCYINIYLWNTKQ